MIYLQLFYVFFKIGLFTIGGGYAMIPVISSSVVTDMGWISEELFVDFIAIAESTPGPLAINIATFIGYELAFIPGVLAAVAGLFVPSFIIIFAIFKLSKNIIDKPVVQDVMTGIQPTVIALILSAFVSVAITAFTLTDTVTGAESFNWFGVIIFAASFATLKFCKKIHPILIIIASAGIGILFYGFIL
ncbi:MAG: chromate transporter [Bacillota bacterium]